MTREELVAELLKARHDIANQFRGRMARKAGSDNRPTPPYLYNALNEIHCGFDWDCCATEKNTRVPEKFFSPATDALKQEWRFRCGWCNPPYTAKMIRAFLMKAIEELRAGRCEKVVFLLPSWTEAPHWFHSLAAHGHVEFIEGRIPYLNENLEVMDDAPWAAIIVTMTKDSLLDGRKLSSALLSIPKPKGLRKKKATPTGPAINKFSVVAGVQRFPSNHLK